MAEEKKTIKVVTITINTRRLFEEREKSLMFKSSVGSKLLVIPKSQIHDFQKVTTWFTHWKGRYLHDAFKMKIPLWLYKRNEWLFNAYMEDIIVENTHK